MSIPICQIAMSVMDLPGTHAWYTGAFGFVPSSGTNAFKGYIATKIQGLPKAASTCWWLSDQQDFFQLELFQFHSPETRPMPPTWRPCDIGYSAIGLLLTDFDETLERLRIFGTEPLSAPQGPEGKRRVCVRDPEGVLLELFENDPLPDRGVLVRPELPVLTTSITVSVPDLSESLAYFKDVLGLVEVTSFKLHSKIHEDLWGLKGANTDRALLRAGDFLLELVQYLDPIGKAPPKDYRISDQGLLNVALGFRSTSLFRRVYQRCIQAGIRPNWRPFSMAAWNVVYVNNSQGFSVELLQVQPWYDKKMGFAPTKTAPNLGVAGLRSLTVETLISAPPATVLEHLADHESMPGWWPLKSVVLINEGSPDRNGAGAIRRMQGTGFTLEEEVTHWLPGSGYDYRLRKGAPLKDHAGSIRVLPHGEGSLVQWRIQFRPLIPCTGALNQWGLRKLIVYVLNNLARQLSQKK